MTNAYRKALQEEIARLDHKMRGEKQKVELYTELAKRDQEAIEELERKLAELGEP